MEYTPEQLREWAKDADSIKGAEDGANQLRAHAAALEESERFFQLSGRYLERANKAEEEVIALKADIARLRGHAEKMWDWITSGGAYCDQPECEACAICRAYRRDDWNR